MTFRESDGRLVPTKLDHQSNRTNPGNTGAGKADSPTGAPGQAIA